VRIHSVSQLSVLNEASDYTILPPLITVGRETAESIMRSTLCDLAR
jgi:hypothetical protein